MASRSNTYTPRNWRTKGYKDYPLAHAIKSERVCATTPPKNWTSIQLTEKQKLKLQIVELKRHNALTPGNLGIKKTKTELHVKFGRRK